MGSDTSEIRHTGHFENIFMSDKINIEYQNADTCYIKVKFGENIIAKIETEVIDQTLYVSNSATCNWVRNLKKTPTVIVYAPTLKYINNTSSGNLTFKDTLTANDFFYEQRNANGTIDILLSTLNTRIYTHTGYTQVNIKGKTQHVGLYNASVGKMDASQLIADTAIVNNTSIQDIKCRAKKYFFGEINLSGNILFYGNPLKVDTSINGSGRVIAQ